MQYSNILKGMIIFPLTLTLTGCPPYTTQQPDSVYSKSLTQAQIQQVQINQQMKIKQKQKIIQNNKQTQKIYVNQPYPAKAGPYRGYDNPVPMNAVPPVHPNQQEAFYRRQDEMRHQAREAAKVEQARQNSLGTYVQEDMHRRDATREEARQIEQARQSSLHTLATDEARRRQAEAEEARQIEQARQESMRTFQEEENRRQAQAASQQHVPPLPAIGLSHVPEPAQPLRVPAPESALAPAAEWAPNEGHLVRAGDLVMELQRNNGGVNPSHEAKSQHIQNSMGVSPQQSEAILGELGL